MKVVKKLDLGRDFDDKIAKAFANVVMNDEITSQAAAQVSREFVTEIRRIAQQAYRLGQENPNVKDN